MNSPLRVRRSLEGLQRDFEAGDHAPLEDLWRAWIGIKERPDVIAAVFLCHFEEGTHR
jgi:tyrosinase